jgi:phytoene dehydrogenase-like protein
VKINLALDGLRVHRRPGHRPGHPRRRDGIMEDLECLGDGFQEARAARRRRRRSRTAIPTVFDRTMAPEGKHVMSMFTQWVPESWSDEPHRDELEAYADRLIDRWELVAPGFRNLILHRQIIGPYDMEQEYGLIGGNIFHGELTVDQLFHMRPAVGYADYRTPIKGLYQASSATHAGGGVNGLPGHHAVREIRKDKAL